MCDLDGWRVGERHPHPTRRMPSPRHEPELSIFKGLETDRTHACAVGPARRGASRATVAGGRSAGNAKPRREPGVRGAARRELGQCSGQPPAASTASSRHLVAQTGAVAHSTHGSHTVLSTNATSSSDSPYKSYAIASICLSRATHFRVAISCA